MNGEGIQYEGRDMDTACAKLLGYTFITFPQSHVPHAEHWSDSYGKTIGGRPPPFSTDIGTAWKLIEYYRDQGRGFEVLANPGHARVRIDYGSTGVAVVTSAGSVPLAICKAVLAMVRGRP
jgi:hypothetical protein